VKNAKDSMKKKKLPLLTTWDILVASASKLKPEKRFLQEARIMT